MCFVSVRPFQIPEEKIVMKCSGSKIIKLIIGIYLIQNNTCTIKHKIKPITFLYKFSENPVVLLKL